MENSQKKQLIILFDGVCNLCNRAVLFTLKRDAKKQFQFASLQSNFGEQFLIENKLGAKDFDSFILVENGKIYSKSTAALRVFKQLQCAWPLLYAFIIVPKFIRDGVYSWVAKNRYKWFGKKETCWLPTPALKARFLS